MTTYEPTAGSIAHIELYCTDIAAARQFFESSFDWQFDVDAELEYTMWRAPNAPGGGLMAADEGMDSFPTTLAYVYTDDLAATRTAAREAGGRVLEDEVEIPEMGVFGLFEDPGGVITAAWEDRYEGDPPEGGWPEFTDQPAPGDVTHFEFYSEAPDATESFVADVYGWDVDHLEDGDYTMFRPPTPPYGGLMEATDEMPVGTLVYLLVADADVACKTIEEAGGEIRREPFEIEGWGTMAVVQAPGDVPIALWEAVPEADVQPAGRTAEPTGR